MAKSNGTIYFNLEDTVFLLKIVMDNKKDYLSDDDTARAKDIITKLFTHARRLQEVKDGSR